MSNHDVYVSQLRADWKNNEAYMNVDTGYGHVGVEAVNIGGVLILVTYKTGDGKPWRFGLHKFEDAEWFMEWWFENSKYIVELEFL